jgi:tetratricopeptide (TPR) repeat protein
MNSMAAMFYVLSFWLYLKGRLVKNNRNSWALFGGCILAGMLAMGSKEIAATLPFFILLYEWYFFQDLSTAWLKRHLPYILGILVILGLLGFLYLGSNPLSAILSEYTHWNFTLTQRLLTQFRVVVYYITLLVYPPPWRLSLVHDFTLSKSVFDPLTTLFSMGAIAGLIGLSFHIAKRKRLISYCILWFFGNLVIESSIIPLDLVFEHRTYLPSMLLVLAIIVISYRCVGRPKAIVGLLSAVTLLFCLFTYERNSVWKDPVAFWRDSADKSGKTGRPLINLGLALTQEGKFDEYPEARINLGNALVRQGKFDEAISQYSKAPQYEESHLNIGRALAKQGKFREAVVHFSDALRISPYYAEAHYDLGLAVAREGKLDEAISRFSEAVRLRPDYAEAHYNLGVALAQQGKPHEAFAHYSDAVRIKPDYPEAHNNLGIVLAQDGKLDEAIGHFSKALHIRPDFIEARDNLENALKQVGGKLGNTSDPLATP